MSQRGEGQTLCNTMETSTDEASSRNLAISALIEEQSSNYTPFSRASTAIKLPHIRNTMEASTTNTADRGRPSKPASSNATLLNVQLPIRELGSRSVSPSFVRAVSFQRGVRPRVCHFPTFQQLRNRIRSPNSPAAPFIYIPGLSTRSNVSLAHTASEGALREQYPLARKLTPNPPLFQEPPSIITRLRRTVSSRLPFRFRSPDERRNAHHSTDSDGDTPQLNSRSRPAINIVDTSKSNVRPLSGGIIDSGTTKSNSPQPIDAAVNTQSPNPIQPPSRGHYGACNADCTPRFAMKPRSSSIMTIHSYQGLPPLEVADSASMPEESIYHPYQLCGTQRNSHGDGNWLKIVGEPAPKPGPEDHRPAFPNFDSNCRRITNRSNTAPVTFEPEFPGFPTDWDLGEYSYYPPNVIGSGCIPNKPPQWCPPPDQQPGFLNAEPPRPSILYPTETQSKTSKEHGRVIIPELNVTLCDVKLSPISWSLEFRKELSEKVQPGLLYEKHGLLENIFDHLQEEQRKGRRGMEIIKDFELGRNNRRPNLDSINWMKESKEADETKPREELKVAMEAAVTKASGITTAEELAAFNKTSRGNSLRKLLKRNLSSTTKGRRDSKTPASVTPIAKETAVSEEDEYIAAYVNADDEAPSLSSEGADGANSQNFKGGSVSLNWDTFATLQFPQAIVNSEDIEFGPQGNMVIKGDAAESLLLNAVLRVRRDHPVLKQPEAFMNLPTSEPILRYDGNVDIIRNHLAHGRWTWITKRVGADLRIDFDRTADMDDARMIFRYNTLITSPIAKFCEGVRDPCGDILSYVGVAKLGCCLPLLTFRSRQQAEQVEYNSRHGLDLRLETIWMVDLFGGEDVRLAKAVKKAVEERDGNVPAAAVPVVEPTQTLTGIQKLWAYLQRKSDAHEEKSRSSIKDPWAQVEDFVRNEEDMARKTRERKEERLEMEWRRNLHPYLQQLLIEGVPVNRDYGIETEDSRKFVRDCYNPASWVVENPTRGWIPVLMDDGLVREPKEKRAEVGLRVNRFLSDGRRGDNAAGFSRYEMRNDDAMKVTASEELDFSGWSNNNSALPLEELDGKLDALRGPPTAQLVTAVGDFPSSAYLHLHQTQGSPDSSRSLKDEKSVFDSKGSSRELVDEPESAITTPETRVVLENDAQLGAKLVGSSQISPPLPTSSLEGSQPWQGAVETHKELSKTSEAVDSAPGKDMNFFKSATAEIGAAPFEESMAVESTVPVTESKCEGAAQFNKKYAHCTRYQSSGSNEIVKTYTGEAAAPLTKSTTFESTSFIPHSTTTSTPTRSSVQVSQQKRRLDHDLAQNRATMASNAADLQPSLWGIRVVTLGSIRNHHLTRGTLDRSP